MQRVLVVGVPRSGTTWIGNVLARTAGAAYLGEPDNHLRFAFAFRAKQRAGHRQYPVLRPDGEGEARQDLARLWQHAFSPERRAGVTELRRRAANRLVTMAGGIRVLRVLDGSGEQSLALGAAAALAVPERFGESAANLVVKSVYAPLCLEWIADRHEVHVVVVLRHPLNVVSSWVKLGWVDTPGPDPITSAFDRSTADELARRFGAPVPETSTLARSTWLIGVLTCALEDAYRRNPAWTCVVHEELCESPSEQFPSVAAAAGLAWSEIGDSLLAETNRPGEGYEPARVAADLPDIWQKRLGDDQIREIGGVLDRLPLTTWS